MIRFGFLLSLIFYCHSVFAYRIVILTDQKSREAALTAMQRFDVYPLNRFRIQYIVHYIPAEKLSCKITNRPVKGMSDCNKKFANDYGASLNADQVMIVTENCERGKGGSLPVISTNSDPSTLLHEYLHTLGFEDVYEYSEIEAKIYCKYPKKAVNIAYIRPMNSYPSDSYAREHHAEEIPWIDRIKATTPIINGSALGTPEKFKGNFGVFPTSRCKNAKQNGNHWWMAGAEESIMKSFTKVLNNTDAEILRQILVAKGVQTKETKYKLVKGLFWDTCYLVDLKSNGKVFSKKVPKERCSQSVSNESIFNADRLPKPQHENHTIGDMEVKESRGSAQ